MEQLGGWYDCWIQSCQVLNVEKKKFLWEPWQRSVEIQQCKEWNSWEGGMNAGSSLVKFSMWKKI